MRSNIKSFESMRKDAAAVHRRCKRSGSRLRIAGCRFDLGNVNRIFVAGAGAFADSRTMERAQSAGLDTKQFLAQNDSHRFFKNIGDLFVTGPAQTHVMGLRILLVAQVFEMD